MHKDPGSKGIRVRWLVPCRNEEGNRIQVGAAVTEGGQVALIGPPDGTAILSPAQTGQYVDRVHAALIAIVSPR